MRVIAGDKKGRELEAPKGMHTRPTLAKVKEAMFGMIQFDVPDARVLDLFAGSGGLGIEALSRGASHAVFCDSDRNAIGVIKRNLSKLGLSEKASVYPIDSIAYLRNAAGEKFDVVLIDPPYESGLASEALKLLDEMGLLNDSAVVICEHSGANPPMIPPCFSYRPARKYGDSFLTLMVYGKREEE